MYLKDKSTQKISREDKVQLLEVANKKRKADVLIKNISLLDTITGSVDLTSIAIFKKYIAGVGNEYVDIEADEVIDGEGLFAAPGFIDSHLHVESSLMHPFEFEAQTLPLGTTSIICDPHEITNVLGVEGFQWFLRASELSTQNQFVQVSSCVPALVDLETNGGEFTYHQMQSFSEHRSVLGLGEMMNFPGVISGSEDALDKIEAFEHLNIDGHSPLLKGTDLCAYVAAGVKNDHETVTLEEANEKLKKGMSVMIREGTVAKNLVSLAPIVNEFNSMNIMLCTDDRNPYEIRHEGHINYMVRYLIEKANVPVHVAYRIASYSTAKHFGLSRLGHVAPGKQADIIILDNLEKVSVKDVLVKGSLVSKIDFEADSEKHMKISRPPLRNSINRFKMKTKDFKYELSKGNYNVIGVIPNEIITEKLNVDFDGEKFLEDDVLKLTVVERYGKGHKPAVGFVKGFGLTNGALAASVAHDCHNLIAVGTNDEDITIAINELIRQGGGFTVVSEGEVKHTLPLPIAGLMSTLSGKEIAKSQECLVEEFKKLGVVLDAPFLQLAFLALPVIPSLKLTDRGLFDLTDFKYINVKNEE